MDFGPEAQTDGRGLNQGMGRIRSAAVGYEHVHEGRSAEPARAGAWWVWETRGSRALRARPIIHAPAGHACRQVHAEVGSRARGHAPWDMDTRGSHMRFEPRTFSDAL